MFTIYQEQAFFISTERSLMQILRLIDNTHDFTNKLEAEKLKKKKSKQREVTGRIKNEKKKTKQTLTV